MTFISATGLGCLTIWQTQRDRDLLKITYETRDSLGRIEGRVDSLAEKVEDEMGNLNEKVDRHSENFDRFLEANEMGNLNEKVDRFLEANDYKVNFRSEKPSSFFLTFCKKIVTHKFHYCWLYS